MTTNHPEIIVITPVNMTEDKQKVILAVKNLFPDTDVLEKKNSLYITSTDFKILRKIKEKVKAKKSRAVLQRVLYNNYNINSTWFLLNKQAAFSDVVSIVENEEESPLGPIKVTIKGYEIETINEWLEK
jgi:predicted RNA binding protein with dsRBD fold (UPF0201 family)